MASRRSASRALVSQSQTGQSLMKQLKDLLLQLQQVQSAVMVSVAALKSQACELDEDIARVLQRVVAERLHEQMDKIEASLQELARGKA
jgi:hypothetical protein